MYPICRHSIERTDGTERHYMLVRTLIAHYAYRLYGQENRSCLPHLIIPARFPQVTDVDIICFLQNPYLFGRDFSQDSDSKAGTGERVSTEDAWCHPKRFAHPAHFILKERVDGFNHLPFQEIHKP